MFTIFLLSTYYLYFIILIFLFYAILTVFNMQLNYFNSSLTYLLK
ncbi:hypothetical protein HMPREF0216_01065 [Clostridium celatum DSM 1785]|uniref:Uncharacterized protein n=1 Tax=Clostridium celatum DSM 1785 TaxID=545697 RepID=L1QJT9_9CLOT|nr:hypothetical protein HMPREF0216_01065 [Clostridium celatum DSM 1785]